MLHTALAEWATHHHVPRAALAALGQVLQATRGKLLDQLAEVEPNTTLASLKKAIETELDTSALRLNRPLPEQSSNTDASAITEAQGWQRATPRPSATAGREESEAPTLGASPLALRQRASSVQDEASADIGTASPTDTPTGRYEDLGLLGRGGMGEVRRVRERALNRTLAMKIIGRAFSEDAQYIARFVEEAQVSAQLQHPGIIPVHELGRLPDGRLYFTMQEIRGREFSALIRSVHRASLPDAWRADTEGWTLRRLIATFQKVCHAVGFAHALGVVHRDLKPSNVMVGEDGEVFVVDWGIAKILSAQPDDIEDSEAADAPISSVRQGNAALATQHGSVTGTPAYMPPEQAAGEVQRINATSDVYALGAILYKILTGRSPHRGADSAAMLRTIGRTPAETPSQVSDRPIPHALETICHRALARDQDQRFPDARAFAHDIGVWLDGVKRREQALALVTRAQEAADDADGLRELAQHDDDEGQSLLERIDDWAPAKKKYAAWTLQDHAASLRATSSLKRSEATRLLHAALTHVPTLGDAHAALANQFADAHRAAEASGDAERASHHEASLSAHVNALPSGHPERKPWLAYLKGTGALTLVTEPAGALVRLFRYTTEHRRMVPTFERILGRTPLVELPLAMGSYLLELELDAHERVRYPIIIDRQEHWHGIRPGSSEPHPIALPPLGTLGEHEIYVPAGYFWSGGDPAAFHGVDARKVWADAFVMQQFPVTNQDFVTFLDALMDQGRREEALQHVPQEKGGGIDDAGAMIYGLNDDDRFFLRPDADGDDWPPDEPVSMINWFGAHAYATWLAQREGRPWRLAAELEWEKAARGVDRRAYPWGDGFDPSWCCMRRSHADHPFPASIHSFPDDVSPYGVRSLAGNSRQWCLDIYQPSPSPSPIVVTQTTIEPDTRAFRMIRGGAWFDSAQQCRAASRFHYDDISRTHFIGLRLVRSWT